MKSVKIKAAALFVLLALGIMITEGCTTSRKCNGARGTRTPMGVM